MSLPESPPVGPSPTPSFPAHLRFGAALIGSALILAVPLGALFALLAFFSSLRVPNPFISDGFICCTHPDTWSEVTTGLAFTAVCCAGMVFASKLGVWLLRYSAQMRRPFDVSYLVSPAIAGAIPLLLLAVLFATKRDEAVLAPSCEDFQLDRRALQQPDYREIGLPDREERARQRQIMGIAACDTVDGKTAAQVQAMLGPAELGDLEETAATDDIVAYDILNLSFANGRVVRSDLQSPGSYLD